MTPNERFARAIERRDTMRSRPSDNWRRWASLDGSGSLRQTNPNTAWINAARQSASGTKLAQVYVCHEGWICEAHRDCGLAASGLRGTGDAVPSLHHRTCQTRRTNDWAPVRGKKRCRMHGSLSTGPRTPEGLERSRRARWMHGRFSREAMDARRLASWETIEQAIPRFRRQERRAEHTVSGSR